MLLILIFIATAFAACGGTPPGASSGAPVSQDNPFAIYRVKDGQAITIGDMRGPTADLLRGNEGERFVQEYTEEKIEQVDYWATEGVQIDYLHYGEGDDEWKVVAMRLTTPDWQLANGVKVGMPIDEAAKYYNDELTHRYEGYDGLWISLDENGKQIAYSEESPYVVCLQTEEKKVSLLILIQK